jgi:hypothetical protein
VKPHTSHQQMNPLVAAKMPLFLPPGRFLARFSATVAVLIGLSAPAFAAADKTVELAWDPNPETNIAGYRLRYGPASGSYTNTVDAGNSLSATATGLDGGTTYYFTVVAYNTTGQSSPNAAEISYTVPGTPNQAPVAEAFTINTTEDTNAAATLLATDPDGDPVTYTVVTAPGKGTLTGILPNLTYRPTANANGADSFTYRASDGSLNSSTVTVNILISPVNDAPLANSTSLTTNEDTNLAFVLSASDPEGSALTYTILSAPAKGTLTGTPPNLTYRPAANVSGSDSLTFKVSDGDLESGTATVSVSITAVNDAPVANSGSATTAEDTPVPATLWASDVEGSSLTYSIVTPPTKGTLSGTPPNLVYTPAPNANGTDAFVFRVNDGTANSANANFSILITAVNDAPVANAASLTTSVNNATAVTLSGADVDGDPLTYTILSQPTKGTLAGTAPNLTYTPGTGITGSDSFTFKVNDGTVDSGTATVNLSIVVGNAVPTALAQSVTATEDTAKTITLAGTDPEGSPLTYAVVNQPTKGTLSGTPPNLTYTPQLNYSGADSFTFRVNDGAANSANATVTINVTAVNDAPVATPRSVSTPRNNSVAVVLAGTDVEGSALTFAVATQPANGTLSGTPPNLTYTPANGFAGSDSFTFWVNDGTANSTHATVSITVASNNRAPQANALSITVLTNKSALVKLGGSDADLNPLSFRVVTQPRDGTLTGTPPNLTYKPNRGYKGTDSFTYVANDGSLDSPVAGVVINVKGKNSKPKANAFSVDVDMNYWKATTVSGSDPDGDTLTYSVVRGPKNGEIKGTVPFLIYQPRHGFKGRDSFTYLVSDGTAKSKVATVTLNVIKVSNQVPVVSSLSLTTPFNTPLPIMLSAYDPDGEATAFRVLTRPGSGKLAGKGAKLRYVPAKNFTGSVSFTYVANDGTADSSVATITINVAASTARSITGDKGAAAGEGTTVVPQLAIVRDVARDGMLQLEVRGEPGSIWLLEKSTNLTTWSLHGEVVVGGEGVTSVDLPVQTGTDRGFYRLNEP